MNTAALIEKASTGKLAGLQLDALKSFALISLKRWIKKAQKATGADIGEPYEMVIKIMAYNTPEEAGTIKIIAEKTTTEEVPILPEEIKNIKGFIPAKQYKEPTGAQIAAIKKLAADNTEEEIKAAFYSNWKRENPSIKDVIMNFNFKGNSIKIGMQLENGTQEVKTI